MMKLKNEEIRRYIWYNAEFNQIVEKSYAPYEILKVKGWREYAYWTCPPKNKITFSWTGLTEWVYIGPL